MSVIMVRAIIFYILLTLMMKLMGKRQIGEMQLSELVTTVLLSELAVLPVTDAGVPILHGLLPLALISSFEVIVSHFSKKSKKFGNFLNGTPIILFENGAFIEKNLEMTRISEEDAAAQMRINGYASLDEVEKIILERTGKMSVLPKDKEPRKNQGGN